jgi:co-chaperonin GroES (HSP10)
MKIYPVGQKLLVEPLPAEEEKTDGGVIIAAVNNAEIGKAKILAVSPLLESVYQVGEIVLYFEKRALNVVNSNKSLQLIDGGEGLVQGDVLAILK